MKNATKHAESLKQLLKKLMREGKPAPRAQIEPLDALVRGAMSYDVPDGRAQEAMDFISREFVDLNELRVATDLEIQEFLGVKYPMIEERVAMITQSLNMIFEKEHTMNLERLKTVSRKDSRQFIRDLPTISPFVEAYVMLFSMDTPAVPVDQTMLDYLLSEEAVEEGSTSEEAQKFLVHHLKGEEMYDFYILCRRLAYGEAKAKKGK